jgi:hypothetical protein
MANYSFKQEAEVFLVSGGNRHKLDVSSINFSQTFAETSYPIKTLHAQTNVFEASVINRANPADFSFNLPALVEDDFDIVHTLLLNTNQFDLFVKTAADIFKITACVITNGRFVIERSRPLSIEIQGQGSRVTRGQTLSGTLQSRTATRTYTIPQKLTVSIESVDIPNVLSISLELQNEIVWTPYATVNGALSAANADTSMYPSSFSLSKKILSGSITAYLTDANASEAQTWDASAPIQIKAGNGLSGGSFRGFNFGPATCSYTNRANTGDVFLHSYDWRMTQNPTNLANELQYITD